MSYTKKVIEKTMGGSLEDLFEEFPEKPVGVGAMGQVYRAKLKNQSNQLDGGDNKADAPHEVAVKVLHPRVRRVVERDLKIMSFFANVINIIPTMEWLSLPGEVETFKTMMLLQLDLRIEAHNLHTFRENFKDRPDVRFPKPYHSSVEILVEEFIDAISLDKFLDHCKMETTINKEIADKGLDSFLKMLLLDNFVHSDLHPGNIFVTFAKRADNKLSFGHHKYVDVTTEVKQRLEDKKTDQEWKDELDRLDQEGYKPEVAFIDAGLVTELNETNRRNFLDLFKAVSMFDGYQVGELMIERSRTPETAISGEIFALKVERLVKDIKQRTFALGSVKLGDLLAKVLTMVRQHHIRMESDFITVVLSILLLEGIGRQLDPNLDLFKSSIPVLRQLQPIDKVEFNEDTISMAKIWLALEVRQFINASIQDIHTLVKYDGLSPNQ